MISHFLSSHRVHPSKNRDAIRRRLACVALVLVVATTASAHAGTPGLANGDFDSDLSGWDLSGTPAPAWAALDLDGNPGSGSAVLFNTETQTNARVYPLRQCIAFPGPGIVSIEAAGILPAGHVGGRLVLSYISRSIPDCTGGFNAAGGYFLQSNGSWVHGSANLVLNPGPNYIEVSLGIEKDAAGGSLSGNIDAVHVIDRDRIFANGFEAPDLPSPSF